MASAFRLQLHRLSPAAPESQLKSSRIRPMLGLMRIGEQPSVAPSTIATRAQGPSCEPACTPVGKPPAAGGPSTWLDRVGSLVDRLAVETRALFDGRESGARAAGDVLGMMQDVFGIGPITGVEMSFDYQHETIASTSSSRAQVVGDRGSTLAWRDELYARDATAFSAGGVITGADGTRYAFTLDYTSVTEVAAVEEGYVFDSGASSSPTWSDAPAWSLPETTIPTISMPASAAESLIERVRRLLGIDEPGKPVATFA